MSKYPRILLVLLPLPFLLVVALRNLYKWAWGFLRGKRLKVGAFLLEDSPPPPSPALPQSLYFAQNKTLRELSDRIQFILERLLLKRQMIATEKAANDWAVDMARLYRKFISTKNPAEVESDYLLRINKIITNEQKAMLCAYLKNCHLENGYAHLSETALEKYVATRAEEIGEALTEARLTLACGKTLGLDFVEWLRSNRYSNAFKTKVANLLSSTAAIAIECEKQAEFILSEYHRIENEFAKTQTLLEPDLRCYDFDRYR